MLRLAIAAFAAIAGWLAVAVLVYQWTPHQWYLGSAGEPRGLLLVYLMVQLGLPTAVAAWAGSRVAAGALDEAARRRVRRAWRWAMWPLLAGYGLTAAFGCPEAHNALARSVLAGCTEPRCTARVETYLAVPLIPTLVLSYAETTATFEDGGGAQGAGFLLHFWNGRRVTRVATYALWAAP